MKCKVCGGDFNNCVFGNPCYSPLDAEDALKLENPFISRFICPTCGSSIDEDGNKIDIDSSVASTNTATCPICGKVTSNFIRLTWLNYGELDLSSSEFCKLDYIVDSHLIFYETCDNTRHFLRCDFSSIFDRLRSIISSKEFQNERPYVDGCDGDWYKFEYNLGDKLINYEGYIYGLNCHKEIVSLINECAKETLDEERKLLQSNFRSNEQLVLDIMKSRQKLEESSFDLGKMFNPN